MSRATRLLPILILAAWCAVTGPSCIPSRNQWTVYFNTSAALPRMGERLTIELLDESGRPACDDCARDFDMTNEILARQLMGGNLSIGVADENKSAVRVRARLYRTRATALSKSARSIDVVARLPPLVALGSTRVNFPLSLLCAGLPPDLEKRTSCQLVKEGSGFVAIDGPEPTLSPDSPILAPYGEASGCLKPVPDGMACVGTGAFLQGADDYEALVFDYPSAPAVPMAIPEGFALMLDVDEVTVGTVRRLIREGKIAHDLSGPRGLLSRGAAGLIEEACTFVGRDDASSDALPINCIGRDLAGEVCDQLGRRLPKEYEWEFAAGNGVDETLYPWGNVQDEQLEGLFRYDDDEAVCAKALVGRGRKDLGESSKCKRGAGPVAGGLESDVTTAGVRNMGGNVAEWVGDALGFYDEPCWAPLSDGCFDLSPRLDRLFVPYRGGSWASDPQAAIAIGRFGRENARPSPYIGVRCALTEDEMP